MEPIGEYKNFWNKKSCLFFISVMKKKATDCQYDYSYKFNRDNVYRIEVKLPINEDGKIDFKYMESFIDDISSDIQESVEKLISYLNTEN